MVGAILILFIRNNRLVKWVALSTTVLTLFVSLPIYKNFDKSTYEMQFVEIHPWVPAWNIDYMVGVDGISVLFIILVAILSILCVTVSWKAIEHKTKEFFVSLLIFSQHYRHVSQTFCFLFFPLLFCKLLHLLIKYMLQYINKQTAHTHIYIYIYIYVI